VQADFRKLFPPAKFQEDIRDLERDVPQLSDAEIILRLMRLVAAGRVSHTWVEPQDNLEFHPYPLRFSWYSDGAALIRATKEHKSALGARIVRIGSMTPEELEAAVEPYLSHENQPWLHQLSPEFMLTREVAEHFGLAGPDGRLEITLARPGDEPFQLRVTPSSATEDMISATDALKLPAPLFRKRPDDWYWYEYLPGSRALYIQYSSCQDNPKKSFKEFAGDVFRFVDSLHGPDEVERVIVDLRFNSGGDSSVIDPLIEGLQSRPRLTASGRLYALIGRETFSSGMMAAVQLRRDLHAILMGEPTGSPPNEYGEVKSFTLPNSKIIVRYTTKYFRLLKNSNPQAVEPDVLIQRSIADFLSGHDQVLEAAIKQRPLVIQPASSK